MPALDRDEFFDLFEVWQQHYVARLMARRAEMKARFEGLEPERHNLIIERGLTPPTGASNAPRTSWPG